MVEEIENSKCLKMLAYQLGDDREDVDRLYDYNPIFKKFGRSWIIKVERAKNVFEKFIFLWFTFNSWLALAVSEKERNDEDVYLLHSIAASERFDKRFDDLFDRDKEFQNNAKEFTELGPIFRVIWLKNNNLDP